MLFREEKKKKFTKFYSALLKIKNENNSNWVAFNSFILCNKTHFLILSWFFMTKRFKKMHSNLSKLKTRKNQKWAERSFNTIGFLRLTLNLIHNCQACTGIDQAVLSSVAKLKQNALTTRPWRHISNSNNEKYTDKRSSFVTTGRKIIGKL